MTSEIKAKVNSPILENIAASAKKSSTALNSDFSSEIYKKADSVSKVKNQDGISKQDKDTKTAGPLKESDDQSLPQKNVKEQAEQADNSEVVSSMQVQQIAMNIATVESKEDIPKIVLQEELQDTTANVETTIQNGKVEADFSKDPKNPATTSKLAKIDGTQTENEELSGAESMKATDKKEVKLEVKNFESEVEKAGSKVETLSQQDSKEGFEFVGVTTENKLDPSKVNIKVADVPVRAEAPDMPQQLVDKITYNVDQGKHVFDIELFPENLGKVGIKMVFEKGVAELVMTTHTDKAHKLLSQQLDVIRSILQDNTGSDAHVDVEAGENAGENFDKDNFQGQSEKNRHEKEREQQKENSDSFAQKLRLGLTEQ